MEHFFIVKNPENTYHIKCKLVVYRALLKAHPDFLKPEGDEHDGFYTKYYLLIADDILTKEQAEEKSKLLNQQYDTLITTCENTGNWDSFPFKNNAIVYYK